jgi:CheY-like chemotaxis protein
LIALTAHATDTERQKALSAGCDAYIAKPATPRVVADEVARLIGQRAG